MGRPRALVFDLDDTLYPERAYVLSGFRAVADWASAETGMAADGIFAALLETHERGERRRTFDRWLESRGKSVGALLPQMIGVYRDHRPTIRPFDDVPGLLQRLKGACLLGLLTDGFGSVQRLKLEALDLGHFFDEILFTDDFGRDAWKPSPKPFEIIASRMGIAASEAVYIGDNPQKDFIAPRALGMGTVRIRRAGGYHVDEEPPSARHAPDISLTALERLEKELERAFGS